MRTRRGESAAKAVSDVYDAFRLLSAYDRDGWVAEAIAGAPMDVGAWCAEALAQTSSIRPVVGRGGSAPPSPRRW